MNEEKIVKMIREDEWMMETLRAVDILRLPDWWICAGFVRSKIWDVRFGTGERTLLDDIDVIYFEPGNIEERIEKFYEKQLCSMMPGPRWSVKNQARMHVLNGVPPYSSSADGISKFPETATALGVKLDQSGNIILIAPWGTEDVLNGIIRPTPPFKKTRLMSIFETRLNTKKWEQNWKGLKVCRE
ncbi:nucleotidyltransferase family protein [Chungangia koreensis]|uniref:Nucleotidyltransferase family protein n=1 Tax=Chungangia koreensis TaxID=752657 RepID=A0ABV8X2I5_9LACT